MKYIWSIVIVVLIVITGILFTEVSREKDSITKSGNTEPVVLQGPYKVTRVIDGDTIQVKVGEREESVRIIGIDAPEMNYSDEPECFAREATNEMERLVGGGSVYVEFDTSQGTRDSYNRLLGYVIAEEDVRVAQEMLHGGFAREYTYKGNPYRYQKTFRSIAETAQAYQLGLWGSCL